MTPRYQINFLKKGPGSSVVELPSKGVYYPSIDEAKAAATKALAERPEIFYASIYERRESGHLQFVVRVER